MEIEPLVPAAPWPLFPTLGSSAQPCLHNANGSVILMGREIYRASCRSANCHMRTAFNLNIKTSATSRSTKLSSRRTVETRNGEPPSGCVLQQLLQDGEFLAHHTAHCGDPSSTADERHPICPISIGEADGVQEQTLKRPGSFVLASRLHDLRSPQEGFKT